MIQKQATQAKGRDLDEPSWTGVIRETVVAGLLQVDDLNVSPLVTKVLDHQPAMTTCWFALAAEEAGAVERAAVNRLLDSPRRD